MERSRAFSVRSAGGRIILLGDGTEVIPDQNEEELFDQMEDHDLVNQVHPTDSIRNDREATPGPQGKHDASQISESPASTDDKSTA